MLGAEGTDEMNHEPTMADVVQALQAQIKRADAAEQRAQALRALLAELPQHIDQDYWYDQGYSARVAQALAAAPSQEPQP